MNARVTSTRSYLPMNERASHPILWRYISNDVGGVKRHAARSGRRSRLSPAKSRRRRPCCGVSSSLGVHPAVLEIFPSYVRCCPPNISSVTRDHDDCANSLTGGGLPTHFAGHVVPPTTSPHRYSRIQFSCPRSLSLATRQRVLHSHGSVPLAVGQIFGVQDLGASDLGRVDH